MIRGAAVLALVLWGGAARAQTGPTVVIRDAGPGPGPLLLAAELAQPHRTIAPASTPFVVRRDSTYPQTLVILGRPAVIEGTVRGDVVVVAGDVYMHPGGNIRGRAIAIGGGVYESMLAGVAGGVTSFRDFTYDIAPVPGGFALGYRPLVESRSADRVKLAGLYGVDVPSYDRSNGVSLPIGADFAPTASLVLSPRLVYRSQLGLIDPWLIAAHALDRRTTLAASVGRGTFSNDTWIWSDLVNSAEALARGDDARNYYRSVRGEATATHRWESAAGAIEALLGARLEHDRSVGPGLHPTSGPWSFVARHDSDDMYRPNPSIDEGTLASLLGGVGGAWSTNDIIARVRLDEEFAFHSVDVGDAQLPAFLQSTLHAVVTVPTFGVQSLRFEAHTVLTTHGGTPRQRWAYLGGPGSISTLDMLSEGGDQLLYFDWRYNIPLERIALPLVGSPTLIAREVLGGARVGAVPTLHQATGVRVALSFLYVETMVDPVRKHTHFGVGIAVTR